MKQRHHDNTFSSHIFYLKKELHIFCYKHFSESLVAGHLEEATEATEDDESSNLVNAEHVRTIIEDCKKLLIPDMDTIIGEFDLLEYCHCNYTSYSMSL